MTYVMTRNVRERGTTAMQKASLFTVLLFLLIVSQYIVIQSRELDSASPTLTIKADGSIDPSSSALIIRENDNNYILNSDIYSASDGIIIQRDNVTLNGQSHFLRGPQLDSSVGVYAAHQTGVVIKNMKVTGFHYGIELDTVQNSELSGNLVEGNLGDGIFLNTVSNSELKDNTVISNSADGIFLYYSSDLNRISMNLIQANGYRGIDLFSGCNNNTVDGNYVAYNNRTGIYLSSSSNNTIYHNDFMNNQQQAAIFLSQNNFDDAYPVGGNYWSDNNGTDSNKDGISDTPYVVDATNTDNFPLMKPLQITGKGDVNLDGVVDIYDAIALAKAYDSTPENSNWDLYADFNKDNKIDIFDALILAANFGRKIT